MMARGAGTGRQHIWTYPVVAAACLLAAREIVIDPTLVLLAVSFVLLGYAVLQGKVLTLVVVSVVALAYGESILPFSHSSVYGLAKFLPMGALGIAALLRSEPRSKDHAVPTGFVTVFGVLVLYAALSTYWSVAPGVTLLKAGSLLILWLAAVVAVPSFVRRPEDVVEIIRMVLFVAGFVAVAGFVLTAAGAVPGVSGGYNAGRFAGLLVTANTFPYFVAPLLPALIVMLSVYPSVRRRRLLIGLVSLFVVTLTLAASRAGWLALICGTLAGAMAAGSSRSKLLRIAALMAIAVAIVVVSVNHPLRSGEGVLQAGTGSGRLPTWEDGFKLGMQLPWTGHGFASTAIFYPVARDAHLTATRGVFNMMHNSYLEAGLDLGIPGALALILLAGSGVIAAWRLSRSAGHWAAVGAILFAGIIGGMVEGIFETGLIAAGGLLAMPFWMIVGCAHAGRLRARAGPRSPPGESEDRPRAIPVTPGWNLVSLKHDWRL